MSKTYTIHDNQGLLHDGLRKILNQNNWKEVSIHNIDRVDFAWIGATIGKDYLKYDKCIYDVNTQLKNILVGGGVKGDITDKDVITNKEELYKNMRITNNDICDKHMMLTFKIDEIKNITKGDVFIVRPIGCGAGGGAGVSVVSNNNDLYYAKKRTNRYKSVIITNYISINFPEKFQFKKIKITKRQRRNLLPASTLVLDRKDLPLPSSSDNSTRRAPWITASSSLPLPPTLPLFSS